MPCFFTYRPGQGFLERQQQGWRIRLPRCPPSTRKPMVSAESALAPPWSEYAAPASGKVSTRTSQGKRRGSSTRAHPA